MRRRDLPVLECKQCHVMFKSKNYNQVFCSARCRDEWHNDLKAKAIEFYKRGLKNEVIQQ
jgi:endogenous inhibitor of DNA gyrase (YacG/DUF329 family)